MRKIATYQKLYAACVGSISRRRITPKRLLDNNRARWQNASAEPSPARRLEHAGRDRQGCIAPGALQPANYQLLEGIKIGIVAVNVAEIPPTVAGERLHGFRQAILGNAMSLCSLPQLIGCPSGLRDADDLGTFRWSFSIILDRRENLLVGQISCRAKEYQRVGIIRCGLRPRNFYTVIQLLRVRCNRRLKP